jgi:hypothetical protein
MKIRITNKDGSKAGLDFMCLVGLIALLMAVIGLSWAAGRIEYQEIKYRQLSKNPAEALPKELPDDNN